MAHAGATEIERHHRIAGAAGRASAGVRDARWARSCCRQPLAAHQHRQTGVLRAAQVRAAASAFCRLIVPAWARWRGWRPDYHQATVMPGGGCRYPGRWRCLSDIARSVFDPSGPGYAASPVVTRFSRRARRRWHGRSGRATPTCRCGGAEDAPGDGRDAEQLDALRWSSSWRARSPIPMCCAPMTSGGFQGRMMEYVRGLTLPYLQQAGELPFQRPCALPASLHGPGRAHQMGRDHRDIKPEHQSSGRQQ